MGKIKSADYSQSIEVLKTNIRRVVSEIEPQLLCKKIIEDFDKRIDVCKRGHDRHLSDIIFHS